MKLEPKSKKPVTLTTRIENKSSLTLLEFLLKRFPYHDSAEWKERIGDGRIKVNGLTPSEGQPLRAGDEITYTTNAWEEPVVDPNYRAIYEDNAILVLHKPAPLPVHAIGGYFENTLMHLLRRDRPEAGNYHLAHRLDSETSGLLLLVKDKKHLKPFLAQWKTGQVQKTYRAIVFGRLGVTKLRVEAPIGPLAGSRVRMKLGTHQPESRPSVTEFKCLEIKGDFSLIEARPLTGRTHQIRVHLEHLGFPIVGDKLYTGTDETFLHFYENGWDDWLKERVLLPRMALHALRMEFTHPETGKRVVFEDPFPEDLLNFWNDFVVSKF